MTLHETEVLEDLRGGVTRAAEILREGGLVALPTETVFGLGADATNGKAVAAVFAAKGRPSFNPLIVHVPSLAAAAKLVDITPTARFIAQALWPGPLTLVLPLREGSGIDPLVTAGLPTLAVRVPAHPLAQRLLAEVGRPIAAPSANPSGKVSPTTSAHVLAGLGGRIDAVLDGGACTVGLESTILGVDDPEVMLLRPGGVPEEAIEAAIGTPLARPSGDAITAPGQMSSHYAPRAALRLNADGPNKGERWIGFGDGPRPLTLSASGELHEAAAALFPILHSLDDTPTAVAPIPEHGLGRAINDRLRRAAAPRPSA